MWGCVGWGGGCGGCGGGGVDDGDEDGWVVVVVIDLDGVSNIEYEM